ncbi:putative FKBP-type peptidyl-prolyl cis-trans isomerase FkpA [bioreactor metagenome]|uniref:peptidylprolyl isomerase n=1 Tax=bioreactor metagenome TaxID=1076179 RepID=A0A645B3V3_9ZZZZ|nr:FKBP-type peptidyl-prolyl cis-trans isomerase [Paludibacter sp.]
MLQHLKYLLIIITAISFLSSCNEDEFADWKYLNNKWLEKHANDEGFKKTESGIYYKIIHQSNYHRPNLSSVITVEYTGKLIDGTKFESATKSMYLYETIPGWQEGLRLMRDGSHFIFYIPADLAYGKKAKGNVPPNSVLIFDIKLLQSYD